MLNYRINVSKIQDGEKTDWDTLDRILIAWGVIWILKSVKEVAMAYAEHQLPTS